MDCIYKSGKCARCGNELRSCKVRRNCLPYGAATESGRTSQPVALPPAQSTHGPGTELKKLLARVGITATPDCSCNARAAEMDRQGCDWCEASIDTIVGWLREQAEARGLPFVDVAGRMLVRRAIRNARKRADGHPPA